MVKEPEVVVNRDGITLQAGGDRVTVSAKDINNVLARIYAPSGIFQPALRWVSQGGHAAIMERPPFIARVAYRPGEAEQIDEQDAQFYNIPVPWQVYGVVFNADFTEVQNLYVFVRNSPMMDETSTLHMFPFPNVFNTSEACMGPAFQTNFAKIKVNNLATAIASVLNAFWSADFNEDAGPGTWYADWRAPINSLPPEFVQAIQNGSIVPWKLLRYYSEVSIENFLRYQFPVGNTISPLGDSIKVLMEQLNADEDVSLSDLDGLYESLRLIHAKGQGKK